MPQDRDSCAAKRGQLPIPKVGIGSCPRFAGCPVYHENGTHLMHTNRLAHEKSPYLLQHAHNPVDWYPWGPEAFEKARRENKPIFLSIG